MQRLRSSTSSNGSAYLPSIISANGQAKLFARPQLRRGIHITHCQLFSVLTVFMTLIIWMQVRQLDTSRASGSYGASTGHATRRLKEPKHPFPQLTHLVVVACHAVFVGFDYTKTDDPANWYLLDYQKYPEYPQSFMKHIHLGIAEAARDPAALLLFSGGKTRKTAGPRSEGESYWLLAEAAGWYDAREVRERTFTEEHARDSFENLLFSVCRFFELTGHAPESVTMIGYEFKRRRFTELHRAALRYPAHSFQYIGTPALTPNAQEGEARAAAQFVTDPYGCRGELLEKKETRDPFATGPYADGRCPPLEGLLDFCGERVFKGALPWDGW